MNKVQRVASRGIWAPVFLLAVGVPGLGEPALAEELVHGTGTDFMAGTFDQTVLAGSEAQPLVRLDWQEVEVPLFADDDITGWTFATNEPGNVAEENPDGQIHLAADFESSENGSWAYARRFDVLLPDRFSAEVRILFTALETSGVTDPLIEQPTGASGRLDFLRTDTGFRVDVFSDRLVAFYRVGNSGVDYPTIAYFDLPTATQTWYDLRFDVDFGDPALAVQVYRDGFWVGELKADVRNASTPAKFGPLAYSRSSLSGLADLQVESISISGYDSVLYGDGTYTSAPLSLDATDLQTLAWQEIPAQPRPWSPWARNPTNPILPTSSLVENLLVDLDDPLQQPVTYDGRYWLCYASGGPGQTIRLAYATDPALTTWTDYEGNPVLSPGPGESYVFSPHVFAHDGMYYLFYDVALASDGRQRLAFATASAPTGPWTKQQIVLERGGAGEWDEYRVCEPFVLKVADTYYLYYAGSQVEQIGVATTDAAHFPLGPEPGGLWTKQDLLLPYNPDPGAWDRGMAANPSLVQVGGVYFMRYTGGIDSAAMRLGTAWATHPLGPWMRPPVPEMALGAEGTWDDERQLRGALHFHDGMWFTPFTGGSQPGWDGYSSGMASAAPEVPGSELVFATRTSTDGVSWEDWRTVTNGGQIQSTAAAWFQYRTTFQAQDGYTPMLRRVALAYTAVPSAVALDATPAAVRLLRPYPNPFNPRTVIAFDLPVPQSVRLAIYDVSGRHVARLVDGPVAAGHHEVTWTGVDDAGRPAPSGAYFVKLQTDRKHDVQRLTLIR